MEYYLNYLFISVLNMSITAGYCILAVLALRLIFCRMPRKYLYVLWLLVAFRLVCPVSVSTEFSLFNLENFSESAPAQHTADMEYVPWHEEEMGQQEIHTGLPAADTLINIQMPRAAAELEIRGISLKNLLYADGKYREPVLAALSAGKYIWLLGMLVLLVYFVLGLRRMKKRVRMAVLSKEQGTVQVYECDDLASPFVMGIVRPRIYLPCRLEGNARKLVLLHENCHIRRKDYLVKPLSFCLLAVYWFHPLVWAAWFCMCRDMEMSCDEKVLEIMGEDGKKEYSRTLLAFASEAFSGSRMPLAFGEHDVRSRIRHTLHFRKPALWLGVFAAVLIAAAALILGTNGIKKEGEEAQVQENQEPDTPAQVLYDAKNPYVGDAPTNGRLLGAIASARKDSVLAGLSFKTQLQTSEEPYEFHFLLEQDGEMLRVNEEAESDLDAGMRETAALMLALIDNLGQVHWHYILDADTGESTEMDVLCDTAEASEWCGVDDIKSYGESPETVQELLDILDRRMEENGTVSMQGSGSRYAAGADSVSTEARAADAEEFADWYGNLSYELYEQAVPWEDTEKSYEGYYEHGTDFMTVLARTDDGIVTVYGCYSRDYGTRGMTVDYKITPDGDSNHNYMDLVWDADNPCCQVSMGDYDRDGSEEIALTFLGGRGTGIHKERLIVFEAYETGTLEPYEYTEEALRKEIDAQIGFGLDTENELLQILDRTKPESSVPIYSVPYEDREIADVNFLSWFGFQIEDGLTLWTEPGILQKNYPGIYYLYLPDRERFVLFYRVVYDYSESLGSGYFSLVRQE